MRVIGTERLSNFGKRFPDAVDPLQRWVAIVASAAWKHPGQLKQTFGSADFIAGKTVFNIGGNKHRLIAIIDYRGQAVYVRHMLTHREYDKGDW